MNYGDAINNAVERTKYLLWERRSRLRWRNFAILSFLCGPGGGGGGGGGGDLSSLFQGSGDKNETSLRLMLGCSLAGALGAQAGEMGAYLGVAIALVALIFLLSLAIVFASNFARVVLVENIVHDREAILEPWSRLSRLGWSVLWWGVGFVVVMLVVLGLLVGAPAAGIAVMGQDNPSTFLLFIPLIFWFLMVLIPLSFVNGYFQEIVIPLMYRQNCTASEAWALFKPLFMAQKWRWIGYMVIHFCLVMAGSIAAGLCVLMLVLALVLVLGIPTFAIFAASTVAGVVAAVVAGALGLVVLLAGGALFQMPVTVMTRSYSMYILQQVAPEYGFLPLGGRPVLAAPEVGTGLNPAETQPMPDWSEAPPTQES